GRRSSRLRAIMDACCDPYHNELGRGPRGGKPRMYFAGNDFDNDAAQALLSRIAAGGYGETDAERRWAVVVNSIGGETLEMAASFRQWLGALRAHLGSEDASLLTRLVVPVTGSSGRLHELGTAMGCEEVFIVPEGLGGRFSVLSPVGLIPAAMLGLDIVKLLEGAIAMNEHFESTPPHKNVVLQYVAINHLIEQHQGKTIRVLSVWTQALESVGKWYEQLVAGSHGKLGLGVTPLTAVNTSDLHGRHQQHQHGRNDKIFHNLVVERIRTDPLPVGPSDHNHDALDHLAEMDLPDILSVALRSTNETLHAEGRPTTEIVLPVIDTHVLGQLFQMLMIATANEGRLVNVNPYDQPGVEQYKAKMALTLGRN
ncbi:MAG: glucose-6-phosphate isomerase, partial [Planctomycetaceae bacterium]